MTSVLTGLTVAAFAWRLVPTAAVALRRQRPRESGNQAAIAAGVGVGLALLGVARWQLQRFFAPKPAFDVESRLGGLEIRRYGSLRVAETRVEGSWSEALDNGFSRLARFIFGENDAGKKLPMTAPVLGTGDGLGYRLSFVMPEDTSAPRPFDARISLTTVPPRRVAVLKFRGRYDAASLEAHKHDFALELAEQGLVPNGDVFFAGYDPPSTLPFLRRNELWVELADDSH